MIVNMSLVSRTLAIFASLAALAAAVAKGNTYDSPCFASGGARNSAFVYLLFTLLLAGMYLKRKEIARKAHIEEVPLLVAFKQSLQNRTTIVGPLAGLLTLMVVMHVGMLVAAAVFFSVDYGHGISHGNMRHRCFDQGDEVLYGFLITAIVSSVACFLVELANLIFDWNSTASIATFTKMENDLNKLRPQNTLTNAGISLVCVVIFILAAGSISEYEDNPNIDAFESSAPFIVMLSSLWTAVLLAGDYLVQSPMRKYSLRKAHPLAFMLLIFLVGSILFEISRIRSQAGTDSYGRAFLKTCGTLPTHTAQGAKFSNATCNLVWWQFGLALTAFLSGVAFAFMRWLANFGNNESGDNGEMVSFRSEDTLLGKNQLGPNSARKTNLQFV